MVCEPFLPLARLFSLKMHPGTKYFSFANHCVVQPQFWVNRIDQHSSKVPFPKHSDIAPEAFLQSFVLEGVLD